MRKLKMFVRALGLKVARLCGTRFVDLETGRELGRGFVFGWRGKIHIVGLEAAVRPSFRAQKRLTYWKQEIGFTTHSTPDFPRVLESVAVPPLVSNETVNAADPSD